MRTPVAKRIVVEYLANTQSDVISALMGESIAGDRASILNRKTPKATKTVLDPLDLSDSSSSSNSSKTNISAESILSLTTYYSNTGTFISSRNSISSSRSACKLRRDITKKGCKHS